jgi:hypothetical protein
MTRAARALLRGFTVAVAATVIGAPLSAPIQSLTRRCVSGCPMHGHHKLHCHHSTSAPLNAAARVDCNTAAITPAGCVCGHGTPSLSLARAVLNEAPVTVTVRAKRAVRLAAPRLHTRAADPPESPPPIRCS